MHHKACQIVRVGMENRPLYMLDKGSSLLVGFKSRIGGLKIIRLYFHIRADSSSHGALFTSHCLLMPLWQRSCLSEDNRIPRYHDHSIS